MSAQSAASCYPWQFEQWHKLTRLNETDHLPQAFLFLGASGVGKSQFASVFSQYLLCSSPVKTVDESVACGQCRSCQLFSAGTHPDMKVIAVDEGKKAIRIDQIRSLINYLNQTSQQGGKKLTLIETADLMNINAANALLKSLEEPAPSNVLILVSSAPSRLPATIRSRCQGLAFPVPSFDDATKWLADKLPQQSANDLLQKAGGRPLLAMSYHESGQAEQMSALEADFLALIKGQASAITLAEKWSALELNDILVWLRNILREFVLSCFDRSGQHQRWQSLVERIDVKRIFILDDKLAILQNKALSGANPNKQLLLEDLILESCEVFR
jgi:DNA polymerase-3 subunit delta'